MAERGGIVDLGGLWREGHGLSEKSEALSLSSPARRVAPGLLMQTDEPVEASCGLAKTATLTILAHRLLKTESPALASCASRPK